jgi:hypothetical protein
VAAARTRTAPEVLRSLGPPAGISGLSEEIREEEPTEQRVQQGVINPLPVQTPAPTVVPVMDHKPAEGVVALRPNEVAHSPVLVADSNPDVAHTDRPESRQLSFPENQDAEPPAEMPSVAVPALDPDIAEFDAAIAKPLVPKVPATVAERNAVWAEIKKIDGVTNPLFKAYIERAFGVKTTTGLTLPDWNGILRVLTLAAAINKEAVEKFLKGE